MLWFWLTLMAVGASTFIWVLARSAGNADRQSSGSAKQEEDSELSAIMKRFEAKKQPKGQHEAPLHGNSKRLSRPVELPSNNSGESDPAAKPD